MFKRNKLAAVVAEFLGAGILTLVFLGVQRSQLGLAYFVAIAAGLALLGLTYIFGHISNTHFNPAISIALWTARRISTLKTVLFVAAQLLGGWAAYGLYHYFISGAQTTAAAAGQSTGTVQAITQAFSGRIMVAEAVGTIILGLAFAAAYYNNYSVAKKATVTGVAFILAIIVASAASVGIANPAIAVGARAWEVFGSNGWGNYLLGPILGAIIGVNLYAILFATQEDAVHLFRRRKAVVVTSAPSLADVESVEIEEVIVAEDDDDADDLDDNIDDDSSDEAEIDVDKAINKNAKTKGVAPRSSVTVTKSKKSSTAKRTAAKKKR